MSRGLEVVRRLLPEPVVDSLRRGRSFLRWDRYQRPSWSQEGEDLILDRLLGQRRIGFYVDVGAHHPYRFSNTNLFYQRGWRGINIDAMPGAMDAFRKVRKRDINLEMAVSSRSDVVTYHIFNEPALNTFDPELAKERLDAGEGYRLLRTVALPTKPLSEILREHLPSDRTIDFMSIDVEGFDLQVLESNDWDDYRPEFVVVECLQRPDTSQSAGPVTTFLESVGYASRANAFHSVIFERCLDTPL